MTCDGLEAPKLLSKIGQPDRVVEDPVRAVIVGVRPTYYADDRQVLAARTGDRVQHTEPADSERNDARSNPPGARVAVSSITGVELVAAADEVEAGLGDQVVEKR